MQLVTVVVVIILISCSGLNGSAQHRKLLNKLFEEYNPLELPNADNKDPVDVTFGLSLMSIQNVDEKSSTIEASLWLTIEWNDTNLVWNTTDYNGIANLKLPIQRIWRPDIYAYNSDHESFDPTFETLAVVKHNGGIVYIPPGIHKFTCKMDFTHYPFDVQKCEIKFGSWTYDGGEINLTLASEEGGDISSYVPNPEWILKGVPGKRNAIYYACCPDPYVDVTFAIHIKRNGDSILQSCKIINVFICFMILMSFIAPPASGTKLIIGFVTMIINIWMIGSINAVLPLQHSCLMTSYFTLLCGFVFSSIIANMCTIFVHYQIQPMPDLIKKIFLDKLPTILFFICPKRNNRRMLTTELGQSGTTISTIHDDGHFETGDTQNLVSQVNNLKKQISILKDEKNSCTSNDWIYLASLVDRCFLIIYSFLIIIYMIVFFPSYDYD